MRQLPTSDRVARGAVAKVRDFRSTLLCVAILLVCVLVSHPVAETGMGDDFAYIWSAKVLAETGQNPPNFVAIGLVPREAGAVDVFKILRRFRLSIGLGHGFLSQFAWHMNISI